MARLILILLAGASIFAFQNCGQNVKFSKLDDSSLGSLEQVIVCDPLADSNQCETDTSVGLKGNLYYLTEEFMSSNGLVGSDIYLQTFLDYGVRPNVLVLFKSIDVSPRSWTAGFLNSDGQALVNTSGQTLNEWFSVRLAGQISLPQDRYEFAIVSDDGMSVNIAGQDVVTDDGIHSPRWKCSSDSVSFANSEKKSIQVNYYQGPRTQIAMQLFMRPASMAGQSCDENGGWIVVPSQAFSN